MFQVGNDIIYLGNQWNSGLSESPPGPRNHDLLYFGKLAFEPPTNVLCKRALQEHQGGSAVEFECAGSDSVIDRVSFAAFGTPVGDCTGPTPLGHNNTYVHAP